MGASLALSGVALRVLVGGSGGNWLFRITDRVQCRNPASVCRLSDFDYEEWQKALSASALMVSHSTPPPMPQNKGLFNSNYPQHFHYIMNNFSMANSMKIQNGGNDAVG